jgi:uridine kinase
MSIKFNLGWVLTRALFVILFVPVVQISLFAPFLTAANYNFLDPWTDWLSSGGRSDAFPYGPIMIMIHSFVPFVTYIQQLFVEAPNSLAFSSILITSLLLFVDYLVTKRIIDKVKDRKFIKSIFLFSPLILYVTYVLGQNDLLPAIALFLACEKMLSNRWRSAGLALGLGVCMKLSLFLVVPFIFIYFFGVRGRDSFVKFAQGFFPMIILLFLPILWSSGYMQMVIKSPEFVRSLDFAISVGNLQLYLLPIGYLGLLLVFWSIGRMSALYLVTFISLSMMIVAIMQIRSVGWYLWGLLASVFLISKLRARLVGLFLIWQVTTVVAFGYKSELVRIRWGLELVWSYNPTLLSLLFTLNFTISILLIYKLLLESNKILDPYALGKKPLSIGISGDSGVGKDSLSIALSELINNNSIAYILGDDYHIAERSNLIWKTKTHLNKSMNDLSRFNRDIFLAANRKVVIARHYNHSLGKFTPERLIPPGDFLIVNGLHAIAVPESLKFDLKVFLRMNESLRVSLKVRRDQLDRGHSNEKEIKSTIKKRNSDSKRFIDTQVEFADLVIETHWRINGDLSSIYYRLLAREDILLFEIHRTLQALNPDISWMETSPEGIQGLILEPLVYTDFNHETFLKELIPNLSELVPNPNYQISHSSLLAAITLAAAARHRDFLNAK